jgi:hypothetical protein
VGGLHLVQTSQTSGNYVGLQSIDLALTLT